MNYQPPNDQSSQQPPNFPPQGQYQQPTYQQQPFSYGQPSPMGAPPKKGAFTKRHLLILIIAIVALASITVGAIAVISNMDPRMNIVNAAKKTSEAMGQRLDKSPYGVVNTLLRAMKSGTISVDLEGPDSESIEATLVSNQSKKEMGVNVAVDVGYTDVSGSAYVTDKELAVLMDGMDDGYGIVFETFADDLDDAFFAEDMPDETKEATIDAISSLQQVMAQEKVEINPIYEDILTEFSKELDLEKDSDKVKINGESINCDVYTVVLEAEQLEDLANRLLEAFEEDEEMGTLITDYCMANYASEIAMGYVESDDLYDMFLNQMEEGISYLFDDMELELNLEYYISGGYLVKTVTAADIETGNKESVEVACVFGKNPAEDDWEIIADVDNQTVKLEYTSAWNKDTFEDELTAKADGEKVSWETKWDQESGDWDIAIDTGYTPMEFSMELEKSKDGFVLRCDEIPDMDLSITVTNDTKVERFEYLPMADWDEDDMMDDLQDALG